MNNLVKHFLILRQAIFIILFVVEFFIVNYASAELPINQINSPTQTEPPPTNNHFNPEQLENEIKIKQNELAKEVDEIQRNLETESSVEVINTLNKQKTLLKNIDHIYTEQLGILLWHFLELLQEISFSSILDEPRGMLF